MAGGLNFRNFLFFFLRKDLRDNLPDSHAFLYGFCGAFIISGKHDDVDVHLVESLDSLAAALLFHISYGDHADNLIICRK